MNEFGDLLGKPNKSKRDRGEFEVEVDFFLISRVEMDNETNS